MIEMTTSNLSLIFRQSEGVADYYRAYADYLHAMLLQVDAVKVAQMAELFLQARTEGRMIFFIGNGGSAATASHFAQDLAEVGRKAKVGGFRALSLTDSVPCITAAGNDFGYETVFAMQMSEIFSPGDVLVAISASGNSPNILRAVQLANEKGGITLALVGFDGGKLAQLAHYVVQVTSPKGEYGPVEDAHLILDHAVTSYLIMRLRNNG